MRASRQVGGTVADRISVTGIRVRGFHGVFEHEKRDGQDFVVDLTVWLDVDRAAATDELSDTVDYDALAERVASIVAGPSHNLIETVASKIADHVIVDERLHAVEVTIHKPQAPLSVPVTDVAVTVRRSRRSSQTKGGRITRNVSGSSVEVAL